jgi:hypothetical protein
MDPNKRLLLSVEATSKIDDWRRQGKPYLDRQIPN